MNNYKLIRKTDILNNKQYKILFLNFNCVLCLNYYFILVKFTN